jgi:hypothetical protein
LDRRSVGSLERRSVGRVNNGPAYFRVNGRAIRAHGQLVTDLAGSRDRKIVWKDQIIAALSQSGTAYAALKGVITRKRGEIT